MVELQKNEGVLLINLGSPKELSKKSVRQYLRVFLSDDNVVIDDVGDYDNDEYGNAGDR